MASWTHADLRSKSVGPETQRPWQRWKDVMNTELGQIAATRSVGVPLRPLSPLADRRTGRGRNPRPHKDEVGTLAGNSLPPRDPTPASPFPNRRSRLDADRPRLSSRGRVRLHRSAIRVRVQRGSASSWRRRVPVALDTVAGMRTKEHPAAPARGYTSGRVKVNSSEPSAESWRSPPPGTALRGVAGRFRRGAVARCRWCRGGPTACSAQC